MMNAPRNPLKIMRNRAAAGHPLMSAAAPTDDAAKDNGEQFHGEERQRVINFSP
jgi:hypothetical protein